MPADLWDALRMARPAGQPARAAARSLPRCNPPPPGRRVRRCAVRASLELLQRVDPILRSRMVGEEPSPTGALCLQEPGQRVDHHYSVIPGTAEEIDAVAVRVVFLLPAVAISNQGAGERRETAATGEQLVENN